MPDQCHQCRGRGYVYIEGKRVTCTCVLLEKWNKDDRERSLIPPSERHNTAYGSAGNTSTVIVRGKPAAISQAANDFIVSMTKAVIEDG